MAEKITAQDIANKLMSEVNALSNDKTVISNDGTQPESLISSLGSAVSDIALGNTENPEQAIKIVVENHIQNTEDTKPASSNKFLGFLDRVDIELDDREKIKTILEHNLKIDLSELIDKALTLLPVKADVKADIEEFFVQRLIIFLSDNYKKEILEACSASNPCHDLYDFLARVKVVSGMLDEKLVENANRVLRILKEDSKVSVQPSLFAFEAEKNLYSEIGKLSFSGDYNEYMKGLINLNSAVSKFFEEVLVMDNDENVKNNRLALLNELKNKYIILTDFSKINL